jgi:hypothetical protein
MSVSITSTTTNLLNQITHPFNHRSDTNGTILSDEEVFLEHDGDNPITGCKFFIGEKTAPYAGDFSASADLAELLAWGDDATEDGFGGAQVNMDAINSYAASWPTYLSPDNAKTKTFKTGIGDSSANGIILHSSMGLVSTGTIQAGTSPNVRFKLRIQLPTDEDTAGTREFDQKLRYTFTS